MVCAYPDCDYETPGLTYILCSFIIHVVQDLRWTLQAPWGTLKAFMRSWGLINLQQRRTSSQPMIRSFRLWVSQPHFLGHTNLHPHSPQQLWRSRAMHSLAMSRHKQAPHSILNNACSATFNFRVIDLSRVCKLQLYRLSVSCNWGTACVLASFMWDPWRRF